MKHRVLIVDDHPDSAEAASILLTILGHACRFATSARAGLEVARSFLPDVAILDIGLPDLSGHDLARALRRETVGRPLFLAAITGWGQPEDRVRSLAAGFDLHTVKPVERYKLLEILELAEQKLVVTASAPDPGRA